MNNRTLADAWRSASIDRRRVCRLALSASCLGLAACGGTAPGTFFVKGPGHPGW